MMHSYRNSWAVSSGGGERNLRRHSSPNENLAQTSHGRGAGLQPYKFTGKELETTHGQCLYDFGARWLDPLLPRWTSTDPLSEAYYHVSPYAYCAGNPVSFVDPDGMGINDVNELEGATIVGERKKWYVMDKSWYEWRKTYQREQKQSSKVSDDNEPGGGKFFDWLGHTLDGTKELWYPNKGHKINGKPIFLGKNGKWNYKQPNQHTGSPKLSWNRYCCWCCHWCHFVWHSW